MCYNCNPVPRPKCHTVKAVIDKGVPYCINCGADVTHELDAEKICISGPECDCAIFVRGIGKNCFNCGKPHAT